MPLTRVYVKNSVNKIWHPYIRILAYSAPSEGLLVTHKLNRILLKMPLYKALFTGMLELYSLWKCSLLQFYIWQNGGRI